GYENNEKNDSQQGQTERGRPESFLDADAQAVSIGLKLYCLLTATVWKASAASRLRAVQLDDVLICRGRSEMKIEFVNHQIDGNLIVHRNRHPSSGCGHFDVLFGGWDLKLVNCLKDGVADLVFAVPVHAGKSCRLLHLVGQLIFGNIRRYHLDCGIHHERQNHGYEDRLKLALAAFARSSPH